MRCDLGRVGDATALILKMEGEGAMVMGMQTVSRSRRGKEMGSPVEPPDRNMPGSTLLSAQGDPCGPRQPTELEDDGLCVPSPRGYGNSWQQPKTTNAHSSGEDPKPLLRQLRHPSPMSHECATPLPQPSSHPRPVSVHHLFSRRVHLRAIKHAYASLPFPVSTPDLDFTWKRDQHLCCLPPPAFVSPQLSLLKSFDMHYFW